MGKREKGAKEEGFYNNGKLNLVQGISRKEAKGAKRQRKQRGKRGKEAKEEGFYNNGK